MNTSLAKNFKLGFLGEQALLQIRTDVSDVLNSPDFGLPNAAVTPPPTTAGTITTALHSAIFNSERASSSKAGFSPVSVLGRKVGISAPPKGMAYPKLTLPRRTSRFIGMSGAAWCRAIVTSHRKPSQACVQKSTDRGCWPAHRCRRDPLLKFGSTAGRIRE